MMDIETLRTISPYGLTLEELKRKIQESCKDYKFISEETLENYKNNVTDMIKHYFPDLKITEEINKTNWPDIAVVHFLRNKGLDIISIKDLEEVTQEWKYDRDSRILYMSMNPKLKEPTSRFIIPITTYDQLKEE